MKTHRGVNSEFSRLAKSEPLIGQVFLSFLAKAYRFKSIADYAIGPMLQAVTAADARSVLDAATRFVETIAALLARGSGPNHGSAAQPLCKGPARILDDPPFSAHWC